MNAKTHFERAIDDEQRKLADAAMMGTPDALRIADLQGQYKGLAKSLQLFRESVRKDLEE